jgi:gluconolactonase
LGRILLPSIPANLTWGGDDRSTLFITAGVFVYALKMKATGYLPYNDPKESK